MAYKIGGKFVSKEKYETWLAEQTQATNNNTEESKMEIKNSNDIELLDSEIVSVRPDYLSLVSNNSTIEEIPDLPPIDETAIAEPNEIDAQIESINIPDMPDYEAVDDATADAKQEIDGIPWYSELRLTIREYVDLCKSGKLVYASYQREGNAKAWKDDKHKTKLFKSILLGRPISTMEWRKRSDGKYECVNGRQRGTCILQTINDDYKFTELPPSLDIYEEMTFSMLPDIARDRFWNYRLQINLIEEEDDDQVIDYYTDLNRGAVPLTTIEARKGKIENVMNQIPEIVNHKAWIQTYMKGEEKTKIYGDIKDTWRYDIVMKLACDLFGNCDHASGLMADWFVKFGQTLTTEQTNAMLDHINKYHAIMQSIARDDKAKAVFTKAKGKNNVSAILAAIDNNTQVQDAATNIAGFFTSSKTCAKVIEYAKYQGNGSAKPENVKARIAFWKRVIAE